MAKKTMPKGRSLKKRALAVVQPPARQQVLPLKLVKAKPSAAMLSREATENLSTYRAALEREIKIRYEDAKWKEIRRLAHQYEVGGMPAMDELTKEEERSLRVPRP